MAGTTLDLHALIGPDAAARSIAEQYVSWNTLRQPWLEQKKELRNYVFATDTRTTSNSKLPWKNSTTIPKLCQIRDNLHANYICLLYTSPSPRDS